MKPRDVSDIHDVSDDTTAPSFLGNDDRVTQTIDLDTLFLSRKDMSEMAEMSETAETAEDRRVNYSAFGKLLEAISVPSLLIARSHAVRYANGAFRRMMGRGFNMRTATFGSLFANSRQAEQAGLQLEKVFQDRKPLVRERVVQIHETRIWARMHYRSLRLGREPFVLVQIENLTAQKQLLATQKYKKLVNIFPIGIVEFAFKKPVQCLRPVDELLDAILDARVVDGNNEFASLHRRHNIDDLMGLGFGSLFPIDPTNRGICVDWISSGFPIRSFETREDVAPGLTRYFEHTLLGNVSKRHLLGFWWLKRDISEKKRREEEIVKTQKLESLGILAGGIAHDFNNLLTGILGNISLAQKYLTSSGAAGQRLDAAARAAARAQDLTGQLLTFSRGGAPIRRTGSIAELLRDSVTFALRGSNVRCQLIISKSLWPVDIDEAQISGVIHNLVINAVQAMPHGGTIQVQASKYALKGKHSLPLRNGKYVRIAIRDAGHGIPPEYLQKIFDPYFTTKEKGSGLGLATSYSVVRKHDGMITVKSKLGVGSNFYVYLPASLRPPDESTPKEDELVCGHGRILVMDDEELIRELAGELLSGLGYGVALAGDGSEAIAMYTTALAAGQPFDVVIMDLTIPGGMGGKEAIEKLREIDPAVKAIVSSGYSNDPIMAQFTRYGFVGVLPKPYQVSELSKLLETLIRECGTSPAGRPQGL